jgi:fatty-acyl-CoA synthase
MKGLMMDFPLTLHHFLERAGRFFPKKEIATRMPAGIHRYSFGDYYRRTHRLARALERLGVQPGDRVGTLAWNTHRHLEAFFAVPCYGAVLHTSNLRLPMDQLSYIIHVEHLFQNRASFPLESTQKSRIISLLLSLSVLVE